MLPFLKRFIHTPSCKFQIFFRKVLISAATATVITFAASYTQVAQAQAGDVVVYLPLYGQMDRNDLVANAERMAADAIASQFNQDPNLTSVQVSILGDRNGEIIPILTTTVSRSEWQQDPRIAPWTRYHDSYALIQRHDEQRLVAIAPARPSRPSRSMSEELPPQIASAYDQGQLSSTLAQEYLSEFD